MTRQSVARTAIHVAAGALGACLALRAGAQQPAAHTPMADLTGLGAAVEHDTTSMLGAARLAALPAGERARWTAYVARSREDRARDTTLIVAELVRLGQARWTTPRVVKDFRITEQMTPAWFRTDSARRVGLTMLSFQTPSGGWSKHVDMFGSPRAPGRSFFSESPAWEYIPTIDNGATTTQLEFLARLDAAQPDARWRDSFMHGVWYLVRAQYPSGGFPQVYPLQGGYHDATTYNDDATVLALRVLQDVATGRHAFVPAAMRAEARAALARGVGGILADQVVVGGQRTVWGQQHDPLTHAPVRARSYELAGLTGGESCGILDFLMDLPGSYPGVAPAVHAGATWLREHAVRGVRYDSLTGTFVHDAAAPLTWARIYELPSLRPVMANRDGVPRYDFAELTDRRTGYGWYRRDAVATLEHYQAWAGRGSTPGTTFRGFTHD